MVDSIIASGHGNRHLDRLHEIASTYRLMGVGGRHHHLFFLGGWTPIIIIILIMMNIIIIIIIIIMIRIIILIVVIIVVIVTERSSEALLPLLPGAHCAYNREGGGMGGIQNTIS